MPTGDGLVDFDGFQRLRFLDTSFATSLEKYLISGEFPKELCRLPMLVSEQNADELDHEYLELPIFGRSILLGEGLEYNYLYYTRSLHHNYQSYFQPSILLYNNTINGSIPTEIGQLKLLLWFALNDNQFSGNILDQKSNLKNLEMLYLSTDALSSLNFLSRFNVSYNNLEGPIPASTQFQSFNASAFEGNPKLCGSPLPNECRPIHSAVVDGKNNEDVDNGLRIPWFHISIALGFLFGFWGACGPLMLKGSWRDAYFRVTDNVQDRLYVMITWWMTRMQRRIRN